MTDEQKKTLSNAIELFEENKNPYKADKFKGLMQSIKLFIELAKMISKDDPVYGDVLYYIAIINYKFGNHDLAYHIGSKAKELLRVNKLPNDCFDPIDISEIRKKSINSGWVSTYREKKDIPSQLTLMLDSLSTTFSDDVNFSREYTEGEEYFFSHENAFSEVYPLSYVKGEDLDDLSNFYSSLFEQSSKSKEYFILEIKGGNHSLHGEIAFIKANPVQEIRGTDGRFFSRSVVDHYCDETETFIIPADPILINPIIFEAQSNNGVWTAEMSDFKDETTFDETNGRRIKVHMFKGF